MPRNSQATHLSKTEAVTHSADGLLNQPTSRNTEGTTMSHSTGMNKCEWTSLGTWYVPAIIAGIYYVRNGNNKEK
jgi:hypothetical protein